MATPAQITANRLNAERSTGPKTEEGKARSCRNRLSHGFAGSMLLITGEEREQFNLLLADLHHEFQPATASEQILLERMAQNQWLSLRACRLQSVVLTVPADTGRLHPDLGLLIRYQQSSDRGFYKARTELINAQKERKKSEIGFEPQNAGQPVAESPNPPEPPQETAVNPEISLPVPPKNSDLDFLENNLEVLMAGCDLEMAKEKIAELRARRQAA